MPMAGVPQTLESQQLTRSHARDERLFLAAAPKGATASLVKASLVSTDQQLLLAVIVIRVALLIVLTSEAEVSRQIERH